MFIVKKKEHSFFLVVLFHVFWNRDGYTYALDFEMLTKWYSI